MNKLRFLSWDGLVGGLTLLFPLLTSVHEVHAQSAGLPADCRSAVQARVYRSALSSGLRLGDTYWNSFFGADCQRFESYVETLVSFPLSAPGCFTEGFLDGLNSAIDEVEGQCFDACLDTGVSTGISLGVEFCDDLQIAFAQSASLCTVFSLTGCQLAFDEYLESHCSERAADPKFAAQHEALRAECEQSGPVISRRTLREESEALQERRRSSAAR